MPQIIPIKELKNTNHISELCQNSDEPIFVTKNGYGEMVLMSMNVYDEMFGRLEIYRALSESEKQFETGSYQDAKEALLDLRRKYGL